MQCIFLFFVLVIFAEKNFFVVVVVGSSRSCCCWFKSIMLAFACLYLREVNAQQRNFWYSETEREATTFVCAVLLQYHISRGFLALSQFEKTQAYLYGATSVKVKIITLSLSFFVISSLVIITATCGKIIITSQNEPEMQFPRSQMYEPAKRMRHVRLPTKHN